MFFIPQKVLEVILFLIQLILFAHDSSPKGIINMEGGCEACSMEMGLLPVQPSLGRSLVHFNCVLQKHKPIIVYLSL